MSDKAENYRPHKMFGDVLPLSADRALPDKAMTLLVLPRPACTRAFPYSQFSKAITSSKLQT